jgi:phosphatidylglycerol lysyltransferase
LLAALRAFGRNATSFQLLERDFLVWRDVDASKASEVVTTTFRDAPIAAVGYVDTGPAWVAGGEPVAREDDVHIVAERFLEAARRAGKRAAFFATEGRLVTSPRFERLLLGEQPVWDPAAWPDTVRASRSLRSQIKRAAGKRVAVRRVSAADVAVGTALRDELDRLIRRWQATRAMAPMGFLVRVEPFTHADERRLFVAERDGQLVALLSMAPVYARNGWLFEDLLRDPAAPNGTTELLVDAGMRDIANDGSRWATLGLAPLAGPVTPLLARVRTLSTPFFNFAGLQAFKAKLRPHTWEPIWLAYPAGSAWWRALLDALTAFAGGSLLRFAWDTLRRGPRPVLVAMTALLVPWTITLGLLDTARWFPEPWMQRAWVTFDALLCVALVMLILRWRSWLGTLVAMAVTADALTTLVQAITWYGPRAATIADWLLIALVCTAPLLAAIVLWGTVSRHRVSEARV